MNIARYAARYCQINLALTHLPPLEKGPRHAGWQLLKNAITDPAAAFDYFTRHPDHGVAALLEHSRLVSLDIDHPEHAAAVLAHFDMDLEELKAAAPCIVGRHFRLMYRAPAAALTYRALGWPKREKPGEAQTIFELRTGPRLDVLPPTIHPSTRLPYRWANPPRSGFPEVPPRLLDLWQNWPTIAPQAIALCPWAPSAPPAPVLSRSRDNSRSRESVIAAFNQAHDPAAILQAHGYERRGNRFASPDTKHAPGISILGNGRIFCHHAGDRLSDHHSHDAFDLFRLLDHAGDLRAAVKAAADLLRGNR